MRLTHISDEAPNSIHQLPGQTAFYRGKVRDVYTILDKYVIMVATDRISAFDHILPRDIPGKGAILNRLAAYFLDKTQEIVPNWLIDVPMDHVSVGYKCTPFPVEMVVRNYLCGHALREYQEGKRIICGKELPEGLLPYQKLPEPIITPTTKAHEGHDEDISRAEIISRGLVNEEHYAEMEAYALDLFTYGTEYAHQRGLILADTKYEFGLLNGRVVLIDEIHTPDSSRYFYGEKYEEAVEQGLTPHQLSKEFVREWLISQGFQGLEGQHIPEITDDVVKSIAERYRELYHQILGAMPEIAIQDKAEFAQKLNQIAESLK